MTVAGGYTQHEIVAAADCATDSASNVQRRRHPQSVFTDFFAIGFGN